MDEAQPQRAPEGRTDKRPEDECQPAAPWPCSVVVRWPHAPAATSITLFVLLLQAGCHPADRPSYPATAESGVRDQSIITTDLATYVLRATPDGMRMELRATLTNRLHSGLYLSNCGNSALVSLEKRVDGSWKVAYHVICPLIGLKPILVRPGARYRDVYRFRVRPGTYPRFLVQQIPGVYRARYAVFLRGPASDTGIVLVPASDSVATSTEFRLEVH